MTQPELKSCPFCGPPDGSLTVRVCEWKRPGAWQVYCQQCLVSTRTCPTGRYPGMTGKDEAIMIWNERAPLALSENTAQFFLDRIEDATGVSGTGRVAEGFVFQDGTVALRWLTEHRSTAIYSSVKEVEAIHLHHGATAVMWGRVPALSPEDIEAIKKVREVVIEACGAGDSRVAALTALLDRWEAEGR